MVEQTWNTERIVRLVALVILVIACLQVVFPFIGALAWAGIIAITVWPAFLWLTARLGDRPRLAAALCSFGLIVILVGPFAAMAASLGQAVPQLANLVQDLTTSSIPLPPAWVVGIPAIGPIVDEVWRRAATDMPGVLQSVMPGVQQGGVWALSQGAQLALAVLEFLFAILIAGILLVTADRSTAWAERLVVRLNIGDGARLIRVVVSTVRSVSIGLVGTASIQALIAAVGFAITGVPAVALLGFLTFLVALIQLPTLLVWAPAALWLYFEGDVTRAVVLGLWGLLLINTVDNFLRPWLISRGAKLPFALIFMGVIGGLLAWGMVGLFIGPTLLAVAYSLIRTWLGEAVGVPAEPEPPL